MNQQEIILINSSIDSYKKMIKYLRSQMLLLEKKKMKIKKNCEECIKLPIKDSGK